MAERSAARRNRNTGSRSPVPGSSPGFEFQLVCLWPIKIGFKLNYLFQLFTRPTCLYAINTAESK